MHKLIEAIKSVLRFFAALILLPLFPLIVFGDVLLVFGAVLCGPTLVLIGLALCFMPERLLLGLLLIIVGGCLALVTFFVFGL